MSLKSFSSNIDELIELIVDFHERCAWQFDFIVFMWNFDWFSMKLFENTHVVFHNILSDESFIFIE